MTIRPPSPGRTRVRAVRLTTEVTAYAAVADVHGGINHADAQGDATLHLSTRTVAWLAGNPDAPQVVSSVGDKLTELERAGQHPEAIAALRRVLTHQQPTSAGRCRTCRRRAWRRPPFPCIVWHQIRGELLCLFADGGRHRQSTTRI
ncbi:MAG: hypothetical protein ACRDSZ_08265 [Pseudonocardiaceae bacterium]